MKKVFAEIPEALEELKKGRMIIIADTHRENESDFYIPAELIDPQKIMSMIRYGGGLICCAITSEQANKLRIPLMVSPEENTEATRLNLTLSVNAKQGITTGISAYDRTKTIKILADPNSKPEDLTIPGHVFGVIAKPGGILQRSGHTEAAVDLARLAGFNPAGVLCEIIRRDGLMATLQDINKLSQKLNIKVISINDLVSYRKQHQMPNFKSANPLLKVAHANLPTEYGNFEISIYRSLENNREHAVLSMGKIQNSVLTRLHSQCLTGDTFMSLRCDCRNQLHQSMQKIKERGSGIIIYLSQEGRGIGLMNKIKSYALQEKGLDTVESNHALGFPADARDYKIAADILRNLHINTIDLLTNNPDKQNQLTRYGIKINKLIAIETKPHQFNKKYLLTKKNKLGHKLEKI